jgi:hypothetical protein
MCVWFQDERGLASNVPFPNNKKSFIGFKISNTNATIPRTEFLSRMCIGKHSSVKRECPFFHVFMVLQKEIKQILIEKDSYARESD